MSNLPQLRSYQQRTVDEVRAAIAAGHKRILVVIPTGGGKCLGYDTPVLMADGSIKAVQGIEAGESVMGPDSQPRLVVSTCQGREAMYRITPTKGAPFECNASHILSFVNIGKETRFRYMGVVNLSVVDYLALPKHVRHCLKLWRTSVDFQQQAVPLDPYFLGLWLGDGHAASARITNIDPEITAYLQAFAQSQGMTHKAYQDPRSRAIIHSITGTRGGHQAHKTSVHLMLKNMGVLNNKHIPTTYLHNSVEVRRAVLAGLLDSDGHLHHGHYELVTVGTQLRDDILYLCRSLGLAAYYSTKPTDGKPTFRITISGHLAAIPCLIPRKRCAPRQQVKDVLRTGFTVQALGEGDYYGFELSGPDRLFLLGDFTVTHNTTIGGFMVHGTIARGGRALWLAHRKELVEQAHERISDSRIGFGIPAGLIMAGFPPRRKHQVQVASIATLIRRELPAAGVVLVDEAHHSVSAGFLGVLEQYPHAIIIGLTATPYRLDGRGLGDVYTALVAPVSIADLQAQGYLTPVRYFGTRKDLEPKLDEVKTVGGDYDSAALFKQFDRRALYDGVVANYRRFADASRAVVFNVNVEHSLNVCQAFRDAGIGAAHVDGETPRAERERILQQFREGAFEVLCNVNILTEGFDLPAIETVIINRATKSKSLYLQMVGRGLRPALGKSACTVIDQGGNVRHFGPVEHPEEHELETTDKKKGGSGATSAPPMKSCPQCERLDLLFVATCPECGHQYSTGEMKLQQEEFIELTPFLPKGVEVKAGKPKKPVPEHLKKGWLEMNKEELKEYAELQGYKPGWVYCQLKRQAEAQESNQLAA